MGSPTKVPGLAQLSVEKHVIDSFDDVALAEDVEALVTCMREVLECIEKLQARVDSIKEELEVSNGPASNRALMTSTAWRVRAALLTSVAEEVGRRAVACQGLGDTMGVRQLEGLAAALREGAEHE